MVAMDHTEEQKITIAEARRQAARLVAEVRGVPRSVRRRLFRETMSNIVKKHADMIEG
jgi:hypothetical protein